MSEEPNVVYGRLLESAHISGYGFERMTRELELLLAGDDWRRVGPGFDDVNAFMRSIDLSAFNLGDKKKLHQRIRELQPKAQATAIAEMTGSPPRTVQRHVRDPKTPNGAPGPEHANSDQEKASPETPNGVSAYVSPLQRPPSEIAKHADKASRREKRHHQREQAKRDRAAVEAAGISHAPTIRLAYAVDWLAEQDDCDLLLTDPPYSTDVPDVREFAREWLPAALKKVRPTGRAYVCIGAYPRELCAYLDVATGDFTLANVLVWTYRNTLGPSPSHDYKLNWQAILYYRGPDALPLDCPEMVEQFSVQDINAPDGRHGDRWHAWQKPDELGNRFVRHATKPGDLILDPFAGTGTFLLAAARLGRRAAGCDISEEHIAIAHERGCIVES